MHAIRILVFSTKVWRHIIFTYTCKSVKRPNLVFSQANLRSVSHLCYGPSSISSQTDSVWWPWPRQILFSEKTSEWKCFHLFWQLLFQLSCFASFLAFLAEPLCHCAASLSCCCFPIMLTMTLVLLLSWAVLGSASGTPLLSLLPCYVDGVIHAACIWHHLSVQTQDSTSRALRTKVSSPEPLLQIPVREKWCRPAWF